MSELDIESYLYIKRREAYYLLSSILSSYSYQQLLLEKKTEIQPYLEILIYFLILNSHTFFFEKLTLSGKLLNFLFKSTYSVD